MSAYSKAPMAIFLQLLHLRTSYLVQRFSGGDNKTFSVSSYPEPGDVLFITEVPLEVRLPCEILSGSSHGRIRRTRVRGPHIWNRDCVEGVCC